MSKIFKPVKVTKLRLSIIKFIKEFEPSQKADKAFQANEFTRWTEEQSSDFANSCILNQAPSKFIFADVEKCLKNATRPSDKKYFQEWLDAGVRYLNLDSNNRCMNIVAFYNSTVKLTAGDYYLDDDIYPIEESLNDTYATLPDVVREYWEQSELDLEIYVDVTREQLSDIFLKINDGKPLNNPEKRNAMTSTIAVATRELASEFRDVFINDNNKWFTEQDQNRRGLDDFIACMCFHFQYGIDKSATPKELQEMYQIGKLEDEKVNIFKKRFTSFVNDVMISDVNALTLKNMLFDLWVVYFKNLKKKQVVKPGKMKEFIKNYVQIVGDLLNDTQRLYTHSTWKSPKTFEVMIGGRQPANNRERYEAIKLLLDSELFTSKGKRVVSDTDKLKAAARDNFKTPEGKDIVLSKLNDGKSYHKGHVDPYADTLETNLDNTVIQESEDNLSLGRKKVVV
jgi:hypothetical protein